MAGPEEGTAAASFSGRGRELARVAGLLDEARAGLERGDRDSAARLYEQAGPVRSWNPLPALRLIAWAQGLAVAICLAGSGDNGLHVVTVWQSKAHADRFEAEQLFPAFQALGMMSGIMDDMEFTAYDAGELYIRPQ